jgi:hypothetical protein
MRPDVYIEPAKGHSAARGRGWRILTAVIVAVGVTVVAASVGRAAPAPLAQALTANGAARLGAGTGAAILGGQGMLPGQSVSGTVTVANVGNAPGRFELSASILTDKPGPNGGRLGDRLRLTVLDVGEGRSIYRGSLAGLSLAALGTFAPEATHTYRLTVTLPRGQDDNSYQSASTSITFNWLAQTGAQHSGA